MAKLPAAVQTLESDLRGIFVGRFRSLVAYGLHRHAERHDIEAPAHQAPLVHTLAVVDGLTAADLRACAARVGSWHEAGLATPLMLAAHEFERSLDAFPFEFGDILSNHVIVSGNNPFEGLSVDPADFRRACEVQARGHLTHLREGYLETRGRADALAVLIVRSAPAFATLIASIAGLEKRTPDDVVSAARFADKTLGLHGTTVVDIVALAGITEISSADAERLFPPYLEAVERLVNYVDGWTRT